MGKREREREREKEKEGEREERGTSTPKSFEKGQKVQPLDIMKSPSSRMRP